MDAARLLAEYVSRHNAGVASGDFAPLTALFADDARLIFTGALNRTFAGRAAIAEAFATTPPSAGIDVEPARDERGETRAGYAFQDAAGRPAGTIALTVADGRIASLVITIDPAPPSTGCEPPA
ncbi:MAG: nuclear transport factor 2 family protein [Proteobacteria bacterium]|nr:nuclear transport factor 2 family protein [Pseudomonadota bacterium]